MRVVGMFVEENLVHLERRGSIAQLQRRVSQTYQRLWESKKVHNCM